MASFAFRHRFYLIPLLLVVAAAGSWLLAPVPPFPSLVGKLSLPRGAIYGGMHDQLAWLLLPLALVAAGAVLRAWGTSYLRGEIMRDRDVHADRLVVQGPFRFTRNPLYLANLLYAIAYGIVLPPPGLIIAFVLMLAMGLALIAAEEPALRSAHRDAFAQYAKRVPRLLPRLTPARDVPSADVRQDWKGAWNVEAPIALLFVATIASVIAWWLGPIVFALALLWLGPNARR